MKVLDCESVQSAYRSLELITSIPREHIREFLINHNQSNEDDHFILMRFKDRFNISLKYDSTCWFHFTRLEKFDPENGLLPSEEAKEKIWEYLSSLLKKDEIKLFKEFNKKLKQGEINDHYGRLYLDKVNGSFDDSPCAYLIKDSGYNLEINRDYLGRAPEIVEDICISFENFSNIDLLDRYIKSTNPCIIKFKTKDNNPDCIGPVLLYLFDIEHKRAISFGSNNSFSGYGKIIPEKDILGVEYPNITL